MTWEEFQEELEHLYAWMSKHKRPLGSWLDSVRRWSIGDH